MEGDRKLVLDIQHVLVEERAILSEEQRSEEFGSGKEKHREVLGVEGRPEGEEERGDGVDI